jgi:hypothetical protein
MAKSYKICPCSLFDKSKFEQDTLNLNPQGSLIGVPESPNTKIFRSNLGVVFADFETYRIEHEHNVNVSGRINGTFFTQFIRKGEILSFHSQSQELLLLTGKKVDILDFCKYTENTDLIEISTIEVDMAQLQEKLSSVNLVWFRFPKGMIKASALMGEHIEKTQAFIEAKQDGEISTLSFHLEDDTGTTHPIMVTHDGAIVLQSTYQDPSREIAIVLEVKQVLLDGIYSVRPISKKKSVKSVKLLKS